MDLIEKICEKTGKTKEEIWELVEKKRKELDYLISEDGAIHIIASELGVDQGKSVKVRNLKDGMRGFEIILKVLRVFEKREWEKEGRKGKVLNIIAGDETGRVSVSLWDGKADEQIKEGDIVRIVGGYVKQGQNGLEIRVGQKATLEINVQNVPESLKNLKSGDISEKSLKLAEDGETVKVRAALVRIYDRSLFFESPEGKQLIVSGVLDDGTEAVRAVFFRKAAEKLIGMSRKEAVEAAELAGEESILERIPAGKDVWIIGRVKENETFGKEIVVNWVGDVDPAAEVDRKLEKLMGLS